MTFEILIIIINIRSTYVRIVMGTNSKFAAGAVFLLYNSAGAGSTSEQWMIPCSLSVNTARRLSKHILTKLCFFNYNRVSLACTRNIEKNISLLAYVRN